MDKGYNLFKPIFFNLTYLNETHIERYVNLNKNVLSYIHNLKKNPYP
jgi:hypothetical protein